MTATQEIEMVTMQVQVPKITADKFNVDKAVSIYDIEEEMYEREEWYVTLVDFWPEWLSKEDFEDYLARKK